MTQTNNETTEPLHPATAGKRMLQGAALALILITILLLQVKESRPEWPRLWMIKPLIVVPLAGAMGAVFYYFMDHLRYQGGRGRILNIILGLIGYIVALWLGTVLGLDGTLWN